MLFHHLLLATFLSCVAAADEPQVLICGDSTVSDYDIAGYGKENGFQGWGFFLQRYVTSKVLNLARRGESTRSFINDGSWANLLSKTNPGDYVIIEMGKNDDSGDPATETPGKHRTVIKGTGDQTVQVTGADGKPETVHSFGWYLRKMIADVREKKAVPVLSGITPRNVWIDGTLRKEWRFTEFTREVAADQKVIFIDHTKYSVERWQALGQEKATSYYPIDHGKQGGTHTGPQGALLNVQSFITAVQCEKQLAHILNRYGQRINYPC